MRNVPCLLAGKGRGRETLDQAKAVRSRVSRGVRKRVVRAGGHVPPVPLPIPRGADGGTIPRGRSSKVQRMREAAVRGGAQKVHGARSGGLLQRWAV